MPSALVLEKIASPYNNLFLGAFKTTFAPFFQKGLPKICDNYNLRPCFFRNFHCIHHIFGLPRIRNGDHCVILMQTRGRDSLQVIIRIILAVYPQI